MAKKKVTTTTTVTEEIIEGHEESKDLLLAFVLDESGSMLNLRDTMLKAFNENLSDQREEVRKHGGKTFISLVKFNNEVVPVFTNMPLAEVPILTRENYNPDNGTALWDGIMKMINLIENDYNLPKKKILTIMTDGAENSSVKYSGEWGRQQVAAKIKSVQERGWKVIFVGAEQNAYLVAQGLNIYAQNTISSTIGNVYTNMSRGISASATSYRMGGEQAFAATMDSAFERDPQYSPPPENMTLEADGTYKIKEFSSKTLKDIPTSSGTIITSGSTATA